VQEVVKDAVFFQLKERLRNSLESEDEPSHSRGKTKVSPEMHDLVVEPDVATDPPSEGEPMEIDELS